MPCSLFSVIQYRCHKAAENVFLTILTSTWLEKGFQAGWTWSCCLCHVHCLCCPYLSCVVRKGLLQWFPPGEKPFPIISSSKKRGGKGQGLEIEKNAGVCSSKAQNLITVQECCSFQHFGEKEYHSHAHIVTIYSGSTWTCMTQNTSVSCHISFIQTIAWTIFHYKKLNLKRQSTGFEIVFLYFRGQLWA